MPKEPFTGKMDLYENGKGENMVYIIGAIGVMLIVMADRLTKWLAVEYVMPRNVDGGISIIDGVFRLFYTENMGAAWGMLAGRSLLLSAVSLIITAGLVYFYICLPKYVKQEKLYTAMRVALIMAAGGAIGNLIDRIQANPVVDMFHFYLIDFPIFNVADIFIVCGLFLLAILMFFVKDEKKQVKEDTENAE